MNKRRLFIGVGLSLLFSAVMMFLVVRDIDWEAAFDAIERINGINIILAMFLIGLGLVARGLRWHYLLCGRLPLKRSMNLTYIAFLINNLLPFRAGDLGRIEAASRGQSGVSRATTLSVAVMERLLDLLTLVVLFGLAVSRLASTPTEVQQTVRFVTVFALFSVVILVAVATLFESQTLRFVAQVESRIPLLSRIHLQSRFENLLLGLAVLRKPYYLALAVFWNMIAWVTLIFAYYLILTSLFSSIEIVHAILTVVAIAFAITVPTTIASLGIIEAGAVLALTSQGYLYNDAFAFGITIHVITLIIYALLGIYGMWSEALSFSSVLQDVVQPDAQADLEVKEGL